MLKVFRIFLIISVLVSSIFLKTNAEEHVTAGGEPAVEKFNASKLDHGTYRRLLRVAYCEIWRFSFKHSIAGHSVQFQKWFSLFYLQ